MNQVKSWACCLVRTQILNSASTQWAVALERVSQLMRRDSNVAAMAYRASLYCIVSITPSRFASQLLLAPCRKWRKNAAWEVKAPRFRCPGTATWRRIVANWHDLVGFNRFAS